MTDAEWLKGLQIEPYDIPEHACHACDDGMSHVTSEGLQALIAASLAHRHRAHVAEMRAEQAERWRPVAGILFVAFLLAFWAAVAR